MNFGDNNNNNDNNTNNNYHNDNNDNDTNFVMCGNHTIADNNDIVANVS